MNIKGCHKIFPKQWALSHLRDRGDTVNLVNNRFDVPLLVSGHMNKTPMCLVATFGTSDDAARTLKRERYRYVQHCGVLKRTYYLIHSVVHDMYRRYFNVVDMHNRTRQGVRDMADVWACMFYGTRLIMTIFHFVAVNAIKIFRQYHPGEKRKNVDRNRDKTDMHYMEDLAKRLMNNNIDQIQTRGGRSTRPDTTHQPGCDPHAHLHEPEPIPQGLGLTKNSQVTVVLSY